MTEEELKRQTEREIRWRIGFRLLPWGLLILIICIGLLKDCVRSRDPIDDASTARRRLSGISKYATPPETDSV